MKTKRVRLITFFFLPGCESGLSPGQFTSSMAMGRFLQSQKGEGTAFVIGESGLTQAVHEAAACVSTLV